MATQAEEEEQAGTGFFATLPTVFWERRWLLIIPLVLTSVVGIVAAFVIHPVYESSATVLIESQQIPDSMTGLNNQFGDPIGQRVARARERVLSRMDLIRLIRTYDLYPDEQRKMPLSKVVDMMRNAATIAAGDNSIMIGTSRRAIGTADTVAIQVAFDYDDPAKAQIVAQQFVNRLLDVDASAQASQAQDSVNFLTEQANGITAKITAINNQINDIKTNNGAIIAAGGATGDPSADLSRIDSDIAGLQAEMARTSVSRASTPDSEGVAAAEAALRVAQAKYSDNHPDVIAAKAQLDAAKKAAAAAPKGSDPGIAQLSSLRAQLSSLQSARAMIASHSSSLASAQARAPLLIGQINQLEKQADTLREQYSTIGQKLQAAQIQARVESEQKGERLTLADPPVVPDSPIKPNRPVLIAGSVAAGLGFGVVLILLIELLMRPIRGTTALKEALGQPPLAVIPDFDQKPGFIMRWIEQRTRKKAAIKAG